MENPATHSDLWNVINDALIELSSRDPHICGLSAAATIEVAILKKFVVSNKKERLEQLETHVCGLYGYNPMIDEPCPACKEMLK